MRMKRMGSHLKSRKGGDSFVISQSSCKPGGPGQDLIDEDFDLSPLPRVMEDDLDREEVHGSHNKAVKDDMALDAMPCEIDIINPIEIQKTEVVDRDEHYMPSPILPQGDQNQAARHHMPEPETLEVNMERNIIPEMPQ